MRMMTVRITSENKTTLLVTFIPSHFLLKQKSHSGFSPLWYNRIDTMRSYGIDPIIPSYHRTPKKEKFPQFTRPDGLIEEALQKCYLTLVSPLFSWQPSETKVLLISMQNIKCKIISMIQNGICQSISKRFSVFTNLVLCFEGPAFLE